MSDRLKSSRMLLRLDAEIASATTQMAADCKRAERAAYYARLGNFEMARGELDELHRIYDSRPNVLISSWLHLAEGLVSFFSDMNPAARGMILRSHALSTAAKLNQVQSLSAAWLAHMDYLQTNIPSMARYATESFRLSGEQNHAARSRASLVLAQAYHLAGRLDLALPWYGRSRDHALADGDEATVSALMHNMAWLRAQQIRFRAWRLPESLSDEQHALLGAESTANFDLLIGSTSLPSLVPMLRAQIMTERRQYAEALALFESGIEAAIRQGLSRLRADLLADQAWCRVHLGQLELARSDALEAEAGIDMHEQFGDRAMPHRRLSQIFGALGETESAIHHDELANEAWSGHVAIQTQILEVLNSTLYS
jgi:tetratricopeptide (TPR) repeat protein